MAAEVRVVGLKKGEKITPVLQARGVLPTSPAFGNFCCAAALKTSEFLVTNPCSPTRI